MYIISYDISNDRIRTKIAKELENFGKRVQYSVFECDISEKQYERLYSRLLHLMGDNELGNVRIYKLCANCVKNICTIGVENESLKEEDIFIV
jgi:CRISPR-associated protein Cas2